MQTLRDEAKTDLNNLEQLEQQKKSLMKQAAEYKKQKNQDGLLEVLNKAIDVEKQIIQVKMSLLQSPNK